MTVTSSQTWADTVFVIQESGIFHYECLLSHNGCKAVSRPQLTIHLVLDGVYY